MKSAVKAEDVQGKKIAVPGGDGGCIYCGWDGGTDGLGDEHVVPYSLGGNTELLNASCKECEAITSYLDGYLANAIFKHYRVHTDLQSRSGHAKLLPAIINLGEEKKVINLATPDHPFFLHMPVWQPPGILRGIQPSSDFEDAKAHMYWFMPSNIRKTLDLKDGQVAEVQDATPMPNIRTFARAIAKIAYCNAVLQYGLNGFRSLAMTDLILGRYPYIPYFVGSSLTEPPPPEAWNVLHAVHFMDTTFGQVKLIDVSFRLFANSGTKENGMPIYHVIVGTEGAPSCITRRRSPVLPKKILL